MYNFYEVWNKWDKFAALSHLIGMFAVIAFFIFIFWFVCVKERLYQRRKKLSKKIRHKKQIKRAQSAVQEAQRKNDALKRATSSTSLASFISNLRSKHEKAEREEMIMYELKSKD